MFLPISIPFINKSEHRGIIHALTQEYGVDLINENYVNLSSSTRYTGEIDTVVNHGTGHYQSMKSGDDKESFIQITFLKGFIFPTGYTLKGVRDGYSFSKSWCVFGIHEGDENQEKRWKTLAINDTSESTYCQTLSVYGNCIDDRVGSFQLKPMKITRGFKHLRWRPKELGGIFITAGIDIYGTLSNYQYIDTRNRISVCLCRCNRNKPLIISLIIGLMIS